MNLRQKAKHFKRLYEEALPRKPYPVVIKTAHNKHFRARYTLDHTDMRYGIDNPGLLKAHIENRILNDLRPIIWDNLIVERDEKADKYIYTLDVFIEGGSR